MIEKNRFFMGILLYWFTGAVLAGGLEHDLRIALDPETGRLTGSDHITLEAATRHFAFWLNRGLEVQSDNGELERLGQSRHQIHYRWRAKTRTRKIELHYAGGLSFSDRRGHGGMPEGELSPEGVYLDDQSGWYPVTAEEIRGFRLAVSAPDGWQVLSAGRRDEAPDAITWHSDRPQQALYLVGGPYHRHHRREGNLTLSVWLLHDDPALAQRYLAPMGEYIRHYSELIGPYPYAKFAVVENRWPTGLGMPSFTLLGSQVLRLPFIPYTSLPHEILHNWWGNGVWVDYRKGNWSEGLTAYLADHWMKERQGKGAEYRLRALQRYSNFAARGDDMPLLSFVSRHDDASQSVGYSKSLMFFHMLRRRLGDEAFDAGLRRLWREYRFRRIGFQRAVEALVGDRPEVLRDFLPWLERTGAPRLDVTEVSSTPAPPGHRLAFVLSQSGTDPYTLEVPVAVTLSDGQVHRDQVRLERARQRFTLSLPSRPLRLRIDPEYDLLRYLDPSEQPPVLSLLFGGKTWLVLPTSAPDQEKAAWERLARAWQRRYPNLEMTWDDAVERVPADANRLLLGWTNRLLAPQDLSDRDVRLSTTALTVGERRWPRDRYAVVRVTTDRGGRSTGFIGASHPQTITALARKLPHYGGYGVLVFDAETAENRFKGVPDNPHSRLTVTLPQ